MVSHRVVFCARFSTPPISRDYAYRHSELDRRAYFAGPGIRCYALPAAGYTLQMGNHRKYVVAAHKGEDRVGHSQSALSSSLIPLPCSWPPNLLSLCHVASHSASDSLRQPSPVAIPADASLALCEGIPMGLCIALSSLTHALEQSWKERLMVLSDSEGATILIHQADSRPRIQERPCRVITSPHPSFA